MTLRILFALFISTIVLQHAVSAQELPIATEATATKPLEKGVKVPYVKLTGLNGETVSLRRSIKRSLWLSFSFVVAGVRFVPSTHSS